MFYLKTIRREVFLHPSKLSGNIDQEVKRELKREIEGSFYRNQVFLLVIDSEIPGHGFVQEKSGLIKFNAKFTVLVQQLEPAIPFDAIVSSVERNSITCTAGSISPIIMARTTEKLIKWEVDRFISIQTNKELKHGQKVRLRPKDFQLSPICFLDSILDE